jgi:hypothetical protein
MKIAQALDDFGVEYIELTSPAASPESRADCEAICKMGLKNSKYVHDGSFTLLCSPLCFLSLARGRLPWRAPLGLGLLEVVVSRLSETGAVLLLLPGPVGARVRAKKSSERHLLRSREQSSCASQILLAGRWCRCRRHCWSPLRAHGESSRG